MEVGTKIKKLRENRRLSQEELAYQLGISQTKLSNIENGTTKKVGVKMLKKACDFFRVDFSYFLDKKQVTITSKNNGGVCVCEQSLAAKDDSPYKILAQIKSLILENEEKNQTIQLLKEEIEKLKKE